MTDGYKGIDPYANFSDDLLSPSSNVFLVTPADNTPLPSATKAIYVGGAGNVSLIAVGNTVPVIFYSVPAGTLLRVRAAMVMATGTTAANILALA